MAARDLQCVHDRRGQDRCAGSGHHDRSPDGFDGGRRSTCRRVDAPVLSTADVFAVVYWRRHAETRQLLSLIPWVLVGIAGGAVALSLDEQIIRRLIGVIIVGMLLVYLWRRFRPTGQVEGNPAF